MDFEQVLKRLQEDTTNLTLEEIKHADDVIEKRSLELNLADDLYNKAVVSYNERKERERIASLPQNLEQLIKRVGNEDQRNALYKLNSRHPSDQIYLENYTPNTSTNKKTIGVQGTFTILGTYNYSKKTRSEYEVKLYKPGASDRGSFWCSCPDHKFNSTIKQMVCKHICFLVCKVAKIYDPSFFRTKFLSDLQYSAFLSKAENIQQLLADPNIARPQRPSQDVLLQLFKDKTKTMCDDDVCPICYNALPTEELLSCPDCKNYIHNDCMMVWLERNKTCVFCRSDVWENYPQSAKLNI